MSRSCSRVISPAPARSTLITSAPNHASSCVQVGPDCTWVKSRMRTPSRALPSWPKGFVDGIGDRFPFARAARRFAAGLLAASLTTLRFAAGFFATFLAALAAFCFFRFAIDDLLDLSAGSRRAPLFLANHALRVEVADAAALGPG